MKLLLTSFAAVALFLPAAQSDAFIFWSSTELKGHERKLAPKINAQKVASQQLADWGNHTALVAHREGDGEVEVHELISDVFIAQSGEATLVYGGTVVSGRITAPNEIRGASIKGGQRRRLGAGDVVHIPYRMPHQLLIESGKQFTYMVVKVRSDK